MTLLPWLVCGFYAVLVLCFIIRSVRFNKLCRQRTAAHNAAVAAHKRGDMEEFDFLYKEWSRLADECERRMGIKKRHESKPIGSPTV